MMGAGNISVGVIGLGYFSQFHLNAWERIEGVTIAGISDRDGARTQEVAELRGVAGFADPAPLLGPEGPDILDLVTPPDSHAGLVRAALRPGRMIICQKPFCRNIAEAEAVAQEAAAIGAELIIHENFRFQPWYRKIKQMLEAGDLGQVYGCRFALRPGDGRGEDAYLGRQPAFRAMPRLLIHETGVHFLDLFGWLFGHIESVYADIRQLNPVIAGEDCGLMILHHRGGTVSVFDGNRLSDHVAENRRKTMGELVIEAERATLRLDGEGRLFTRAFGSNDEAELPLHYEDRDFGGGCVEALNRHVVAYLRDGTPLENRAQEYLDVIRCDEAAYLSAHQGRRIIPGQEEETA
jgi:predicted dehydrogenase